MTMVVIDDDGGDFNCAGGSIEGLGILAWDEECPV